MIDLASKLKQNDMYVEAFNEVSEYQKLEHRRCIELSRQLKAEFYKMFHSMNIVISFIL